MNLATFAVCLIALQPALATAAQRAFVASYGSDTNVAASCTLTAPCRTFATALIVVNPGGEILALDASEHGPVTIDKSVTLAANPGVNVRISTTSVGGTAVRINPGARVVLRGLSLEPGPYGGHIGVAAYSSEVDVEGCTISRLDHGIEIASSKVRVLDSRISRGYRGINVMGYGRLDVVRSQVVDTNHAGIDIWAGASLHGVPLCSRGGDATVSVVDSVLAGNPSAGIVARTYESDAVMRVMLTRTRIAGSRIGVIASTSPLGICGVIGDIHATVSDSEITNNQVGIDAGPSTRVESSGDNRFISNGTDITGEVTVVPPA